MPSFFLISCSPLKKLFSSLKITFICRMGRMINDFIGVVGPGQIAGRDTVTARSMGDIQVSTVVTKYCLPLTVL